MISERQKKAAQAIINVFETGSARGDYARVTLLPGDSGYLTYGRAQTTLGSGNLCLLIRAYCTAPDAALAPAFDAYLPRLAEIDLTLNRDTEFRHLLEEAGGDPAMHAVQDAFFDRVYWRPAESAAAHMGLSQALSVAIVYDSHIHGSWRLMRDRTVEQDGWPANTGEQAWVRNYVAQRRRWLANHSNTLLRATVYRMAAFEKLISAENWALALPFSVRGVRLDKDILEDGPPVRASAEDVGQRLLRLAEPMMSGQDVTAVQEALATLGYAINIDGTYGEGMERCVRQFQAERGLAVDGIAGPATLAALGF